MQRRLGMFACASDITEEFKEKLRGVWRALEQQRACNLAVDAAVVEEVTTGFEKRVIMAHNAAEITCCSLISDTPTKKTERTLGSLWLS